MILHCDHLLDLLQEQKHKKQIHHSTVNSSSKSSWAPLRTNLQLEVTVSKMLVPASWEFLRTESYFPLKEGTKLHFSST